MNGRSLWIEDKNLYVRAWPGGYEFWRAPDGSFAYAMGMHGGSGSGQTTAREIAERLWRDHRERNPLALLDKLGWDDVAEAYREVEKESKEEAEKLAAEALAVDNKAQEEPAIELTKEEEIAQLEDALDEIEPLWKAGRHEDYWWWRKKLAEELEASPNYDPDDVSVRRLHYSARGGMAWVATYEKKVAELKALREEPS
jgi:hypothetical protein